MFQRMIPLPQGDIDKTSGGKCHSQNFRWPITDINIKTILNNYDNLQPYQVI